MYSLVQGFEEEWGYFSQVEIEPETEDRGNSKKELAVFAQKKQIETIVNEIYKIHVCKRERESFERLAAIHRK